MKPNHLPPSGQLMRLMVGKWSAKPIYAAAELGLAGFIGGPEPPLFPILLRGLHHFFGRRLWGRPAASISRSGPRSGRPGLSCRSTRLPWA